MIANILPTILIELGKALVRWLSDYLKMKEAEKKINKDAKGAIRDVKKIKDRADRTKRLNDIINN